MNTIPTNSLPAFYTPSAVQGTAPTAPTSINQGVGDSSFGSALQNAVSGVEQLHTSAQEQVTQLASGDRQDIHNVMIAVEKADVAFQLMMQVRNKIVNAYQEVSKMQF
jgi:flagellar hook-basal body complex protein FliE